MQNDRIGFKSSPTSVFSLPGPIYPAFQDVGFFELAFGCTLQAASVEARRNSQDIFRSDHVPSCIGKTIPRWLDDKGAAVGEQNHLDAAEVADAILETLSRV